jgi:hypothetical protein
MSLHEVLVPRNQAKDTSLLLRTAKTFKLDVPHMSHKLFVKDKLNDLQATVLKINGAFDPELDFIVESESLLLGIVANEVGLSFQDNHVVIFHTKKISGIRVNPEASGDLMRRKP